MKRPSRSPGASAPDRARHAPQGGRDFIAPTRGPGAILRDIHARLEAELHDYDPDAGNIRAVGQVIPMPADWHRLLLEEFRAALIAPHEVETLFPGGMTETCWAVTRSNGAYRVIYIPWAEVFSLAVESKYGPVDIGVHGDAVSVFGSIH